MAQNASVFYARQDRIAFKEISDERCPSGSRSRVLLTRRGKLENLARLYLQTLTRNRTEAYRPGQSELGTAFLHELASRLWSSLREHALACQLLKGGRVSANSQFGADERAAYCEAVVLVRLHFAHLRKRRWKELLPTVVNFQFFFQLIYFYLVFSYMEMLYLCKACDNAIAYFAFQQDQKLSAAARWLD